MGQLNRWLLAQDLGVAKLTPGIAQQFLDHRRVTGQRRVPTLAALAPLLDHLRDQGVLAPEPPAVLTARDELLAGYRHHLVHERGLADRVQRAGAETGAEGLTSAEVNAYMLQASSHLVVGSAKREAADLRALLRYLYLA